MFVDGLIPVRAKFAPRSPRRARIDAGETDIAGWLLRGSRRTIGYITRKGKCGMFVEQTFVGRSTRYRIGGIVQERAMQALDVLTCCGWMPMTSSILTKL